MSFRKSRLFWLLVIGDLTFFAFSLWLTVGLRYRAWPSYFDYQLLFEPFALIFILWIFVFFISDLYRRPSLMSEQKLPRLIWQAQIINIGLAITFFYFIPYFGVAPKSILFINLLISSALIYVWRFHFVDFFLKRRPAKVFFIGHSAEMEEIKRELARAPRYHLALGADGWRQLPIAGNGGVILVIDTYNHQTPEDLKRVYQLMFAGAQIIPLHLFYEEVFNRVPIQSINERWFIEYVENRFSRSSYALKRLMDVIICLLLLLPTLLFYPIIYLLIKLTDNGPLFYQEKRVGKGGKEFLITKFRSMTTEPDLTKRRVTRVGKILRQTRLDELPQLFSVIKGKQSLVGPRPERPEYVKIYREQIAYYDARHLITPGLSGWAQLYQVNHPHFKPGVASTGEKLSYDLYYIKHRSLALDLIIALKTIKTLLARTGI
ncbi:MAG: sugar transferase [Patescibacteria group bacterium]